MNKSRILINGWINQEYKWMNEKRKILMKR